MYSNYITNGLIQRVFRSVNPGKHEVQISPCRRQVKQFEEHFKHIFPSLWDIKSKGLKYPLSQDKQLV